MKWKILLCCCLLLATCSCASMYSQHTKATLSYTADGRPIFKLDNDKSYNGLVIDVTKLVDGSYEFHYSAERTDANGAVKAVAESNGKLADALSKVTGAGGRLLTQ